MATGDSRKTPNRAQTDDSLHSERTNTDRVLADRQVAVENAADEVIDLARESADAVLLKARTKADRRLDQSAANADTRAALTQERDVEDETLRRERATADATLTRERLDNARVLLALLPLERESTDRHLLTERVSSDDAVSNRDNFLGIVSHDLRDLLGAIVTTAGLVSKTAPGGDEGSDTRTRVERIQRYAARMNRLIGDLVDLTSIDAGKLAVTRLRGDLAVVIAEAVDTFHAAALAKELTLEAESDSRPLLAEFDYERMLQVLANLITNAIKFTPPGGSIRVRGEHVEGALRLSVTDTGTGIPAGEVDAVFERFRQAGGNDRRGLGLGLYIARCLVEAHGGTMWAESEIGKGTIVYLTLPPGDERRIAHRGPGSS